MAILLAIFRQIGFAGCLCLALLAYYEGVPWLKSVPGISFIPIAGSIIVGHVEEVKAAAVKAATADLVSRAELRTAQARIEALEKQATQNAQFADAARKQADQAMIETERVKSALQEKIDADKSPDVSRWHRLDLDRLRDSKARGPP